MVSLCYLKWMRTFAVNDEMELLFSDRNVNNNVLNNSNLVLNLKFSAITVSNERPLNTSYAKYTTRNKS